MRGPHSHNKKDTNLGVSDIIIVTSYDSVKTLDETAKLRTLDVITITSYNCVKLAMRRPSSDVIVITSYDCVKLTTRQPNSDVIVITSYDSIKTPDETAELGTLDEIV